jgi:hypothetical protein
MEAQVLQGTWDEIAAHAEELRQRRRLVLIVPAVDEPLGGSSSEPSLSPEERIAALNELAERNRYLPVLPPEAFERESLYDEST